MLQRRQTQSQNSKRETILKPHMFATHPMFQCTPKAANLMTLKKKIKIKGRERDNQFGRRDLTTALTNDRPRTKKEMELLFPFLSFLSSLKKKSSYFAER